MTEPDPSEAISTVNVIRRHVPERIATQFDDVLMSPEWLLSVDNLQVADVGEQIDALDGFLEAIKKACSEYSRLNPMIAHAVEAAFSENLKSQNPVFELRTFSPGIGGKPEPVVSYEMLRLLLLTTHNNLMGYDLDADFEQKSPPRVGKPVVREAAKSLNFLVKPSAQQKANKTWEKAVLIHRARNIWNDAKDDVPPKEPSEGSPFFEFVADLIQSLGKRVGHREHIQSVVTITRSAPIARQ